MKLEEHIYLIDLETGGLKNFIASYVLKGKQAIIIETGPTSSIPNLLQGLKELNIKPEDVAYIAVSHIHLDHGGGAGTLLKHLPNAKVIVHQRGAPHLANPEKLWQQSQQVLGKITDMYGKPEPVPAEKIIAATDGLAFDVGNKVRLKVVETLGHASHHQSYIEISSRAVFPGDAAGIYLKEFNVVVPTTPSPFYMDSALASLDKLVNLKPKSLNYSHFGQAPDPSRKLETYASQLKLWAKITKEGLDHEQNLETIRENILRNDESIRKAADFIRIHSIMNETVLENSVRGFIEFLEKAEPHGPSFLST